MTSLAKVMKEARARKDCKTVESLNRRSAIRVACPAPPQVRKSMARFELVEAASYGTGAVVDYTSGEAKGGAAIVLFVAPDRRWAISRFGLVTKPTVGSSDEESRAGFDDTVEDYLRAVRERDCKAFDQNALTASPERKVVCQSEFKQTKGLADSLAANPAADPEYLGGNETFGFYRLGLTKPKRQDLTISVMKTPEGSLHPFVVLNAIPSAAASRN